MTKSIYTSLIAILILSLVGCSPIQVAKPDATRVFETVVVQLTRMVKLEEKLTVTAVPQSQSTRIDQTSPSFSTPIPTGTLPMDSVHKIPCNRAMAGRPLDITILDGAKILPGEVFTKTWRLANKGSCTWNQDYVLVWFSGAQLGAVREQPLEGETPSQGISDVSVELVAPQLPGIYQSNWKLRSPEGEMFGIGPGGESPFWVRIEVLEQGTPTTEQIEVVTPTPIVVSAGTVVLNLGSNLNLDRGEQQSSKSGDIALQKIDGGATGLTVINSAAMALFGDRQPSMDDCINVEWIQEAIKLDTLVEGQNICYRTNQGFPGYLRLKKVDRSANAIIFDYYTWFLP
jgi:hypothetical protein